MWQISSLGSAERYRRPEDVEDIKKGIDKDDTIDRISEVSGQAEGADNRSYTKNREDGSNTLNDGQNMLLAMR